MEEGPGDHGGVQGTGSEARQPGAPAGASPGAAAFGARCGVHAEAFAAATCGRCGTYVCERCIGHVDPTGSYCLACAPRVRSVVIPWENEELGFRRRVIDTTLLLVKEPARAYGQMADGSPVRAVLFAVLGGLLQGGVMAFLYGALFGCMAGATAAESGFGEEAGMTAGIAALMVIAAPIMTMVVAVTYVLFIFVPYHVTARALGGEGDAGASLRAAAYTQVLQFVMLPFLVLQVIPLVGTIVSMAVLAYVTGYIAYALYNHALGVHRLEGGAAVAAAAAPVVLAVGAFGAIFIAALALVLSLSQY
ncbi:MAG: YIP1 family protein [Deltaproteobacteria bacterium]|nr:YIP1 family protein [Deltaproteobacteria bacterium]